MGSLKDQLSSLVYSTDGGDQRKADDDPAAADDARLAGLDGIVRLRRETSGRKGKGVTTVSGVPLTMAELKPLTQALKKRCGSGGTLKDDGMIEIQGDHRDALKTELEKRGFTVKLAGG
ncbi:translation initiation factor [Larsenimonas suaedae]|uniref:Translation initiation factor n=1 Tax=Larsenimonas suaedae TaxID=1851019 RepID=A0ABU1GSU0_9GAMM|nr:translation initiation factor [Larsenimonas suaedae]MCM2972636.1 translation initiation factor [Larsenimonas suaedae]MDR5894567.1 translation initiation factor [Larsenimonas suaedae]